MATFTVDVSSNQSTLSVPSVRQAGFAAITARALSFPKGVLTPDPSYPSFRDAARAHGLMFAAYVLVHAYLPAAVQAQALARVIGDPTIPVMTDWEPDNDTPTLGLDVAFYDACKAEGLHPVSLYGPHWYWADEGSPGLATRPWALVSSVYGTNAPGSASGRYHDVGGDQGAGWAPYGGLVPQLWQFGSSIVLGTDAGGLTVYGDANAYRGDLAALQSSGLFTTWESDTVKPILILEPITNAPRYWVVAADLGHKLQIDADSYTKMSASGQYASNPGFGEQILSIVPDITPR